MPKEVTRFSQTKRLIGALHADYPEDFYGRCRYRFNSHLKVHLRPCGYKVRKNLRRAGRIEMDDIVPAESVGQTRTCWRELLCKRKMVPPPDYTKGFIARTYFYMQQEYGISTNDKQA